MRSIDGEKMEENKENQPPTKITVLELGYDIRVQVKAYCNLMSVKSDFYVSVSKR